MQHRKGRSYIKRVLEIQAIYDEWSRIGLSNREIWRRHIYPKYCICERTYNNIINRQVEEEKLPSSALLHTPEQGLPLWQQTKTSAK